MKKIKKMTYSNKMVTNNIKINNKIRTNLIKTLKN